MPTIKQRLYHDIPHKPYLIAPTQAGHTDISEGMIYSAKERKIHGNFYHKGIDYARDYGTPVYAAAAGFAVAFYHRFVPVNPDGSIRTYNGLPIGNGLGLSVQITHPEKICGVETSRITQYGHLSQLAPGLTPRFTSATDVNWDVIPVEINRSKRSRALSSREVVKIANHNRKLVEEFPWLAKVYGMQREQDLSRGEIYFANSVELQQMHKQGSPEVQWVEQGDLIGFVGDSALFWGDADYDEDKLPARLPDKEDSEKWDETHLHFEEAARHSESRAKHRQRDPYGLYLGCRNYRLKNFKNTLFKDIK